MTQYRLPLSQPLPGQCAQGPELEHNGYKPKKFSTTINGEVYVV